MPSPDSTPSCTNSFSVLRKDGPTGAVWSLCGEIDPPMGQSLLHAIYNSDRGRILFLLETPGGLAHLTLGLLKELEPLAPGLETRAIGSCASAGVHLLQAGSRRTAYPHTQFFTHAISADTVVNTTNAKNVAISFEQDLDAWVEVIRRRTPKKRPAFWKHWFQLDRYFDAQEALSLGLIDAIVD